MTSLSLTLEPRAADSYPYAQGFCYEEEEIESFTPEEATQQPQVSVQKRPRHTLSFTDSEPLPTSFRKPLALYRVDELQRLQSSTVSGDSKSSESASQSTPDSQVTLSADIRFARDCFAGETQSETVLAPAFQDLLKSVCKVYETLHPGKKANMSALCSVFQ